LTIADAPPAAPAAWAVAPYLLAFRAVQGSLG